MGTKLSLYKPSLGGCTIDIPRRTAIVGGISFRRAIPCLLLRLWRLFVFLSACISHKPRSKAEFHHILNTCFPWPWLGPPPEIIYRAWLCIGGEVCYIRSRCSCIVHSRGLQYYIAVAETQITTSPSSSSSIRHKHATTYATAAD